MYFPLHSCYCVSCNEAIAAEKWLIRTKILNINSVFHISARGQCPPSQYKVKIPWFCGDFYNKTFKENLKTNLFYYLNGCLVLCCFAYTANRSSCSVLLG